MTEQTLWMLVILRADAVVVCCAHNQLTLLMRATGLLRRQALACAGRMLPFNPVADLTIGVRRADRARHVF